MPQNEDGGLIDDVGVVVVRRIAGSRQRGLEQACIPEFVLRALKGKALDLREESKGLG